MHTKHMLILPNVQLTSQIPTHGCDVVSNVDGIHLSGGRSRDIYFQCNPLTYISCQVADPGKGLDCFGAHKIICRHQFTQNRQRNMQQSVQVTPPPHTWKSVWGIRCTLHFSTWDVLTKGVSANQMLRFIYLIISLIFASVFRNRDKKLKSKKIG